jgi:hypothetical protein
MKGWKTVALAVLTAIFGALELFDFTSVITGENAPFIISALGILFAYLRKLTTTSLGEKVAFTEKQAVEFGNYLLSEKREFNTSSSVRRNVTHADLENFKSNQ